MSKWNHTQFHTFHKCDICLVWSLIYVRHCQINQSEDEVHMNRLEQEEKREIDEVAAVAKRLEEKYVSNSRKPLVRKFGTL